MLAWGALFAVTLVLASLLQTVAATALPTIPFDEGPELNGETLYLPEPVGRWATPRPSRARCQQPTGKRAFPNLPSSRGHLGPGSHRFIWVPG